jgi:hypothetical protein
VSTRTDLYFPPPDPSFNLKLRREGGAHVELKRRLGGPAPHSFGSDVDGSVEQWYKWSFSLDDSPELWTADPTGLWLPVTKTRTLHGFDDPELRWFDERLAGSGVTVHVEVTEVEALSETAWTCGLEAAGDPDELGTAVSVVGSALFGSEFPISLSAEQSFGYVEWLRRLTSDAGPAEEILVERNGTD